MHKIILGEQIFYDLTYDLCLNLIKNWKSIEASNQEMYWISAILNNYPFPRIFTFHFSPFGPMIWLIHPIFYSFQKYDKFTVGINMLVFWILNYLFMIYTH